MRPSSFHARIVSSCVAAPRRLWTCISSTWSVPIFRSDASIRWIPSRFPRRSTLVAMKSSSRIPSSSRMPPSTVSESP